MAGSDVEWRRDKQEINEGVLFRRNASGKQTAGTARPQRMSSELLGYKALQREWESLSWNLRLGAPLARPHHLAELAAP